jgi:hypothetical protein
VTVIEMVRPAGVVDVVVVVVEEVVEVVEVVAVDELVVGGVVTTVVGAPLEHPAMVRAAAATTATAVRRRIPPELPSSLLA